MNFNPNANSLSLGPVSANGLETTPTADSSASATRIITRSDASCEADGGGGKWNSLRSQVLAQIEAIDKSTPWGEREPGWWLHMMEVARLIRTPTKHQ